MKHVASLHSYAESIVLLSFDPLTGHPFPLPDQVGDLTLAGAILFDASFDGLINDDWKQLTVIHGAAAGRGLTGKALRCLKHVTRPVPLRQALMLVASHAETLRSVLMDEMASKGYLVRKRKRFQAVSASPVFVPGTDYVLNIREIIRKTVLGDELPEIHVPALISLVMASGLVNYLFSNLEIEQHQGRIRWLSGMESLGREMVRAVHALEKTDLEKGAAKLIGMTHGEPMSFAGGMDAVLSSLNFLYGETGIRKGRKLISGINQPGGFICPGCAWPNPDHSRSRFEFCENGVKNVCAEATNKALTTGFFNRWSLHDLGRATDHWLENAGRITLPLLKEEGETHFRPVTWDQAFGIVALEMKSLDHPDQAVFYASGRTSIEAAFLYQLLARFFGTNNLPNSANLCHEPSGYAMVRSLGIGKSPVRINDMESADAIFIFGHNPGSNHPRMLKTLQSAVRNGCRIIAVNPMPEAGLLGFSNPQDPGSYLGRQTNLAAMHLTPRINGDMALVRGIAKAVIEMDKEGRQCLDRDFISKYTTGFDDYVQVVTNTPWDSLVSGSGVEKKQMVRAAEIYAGSARVIASWCLGITHHINSVETIQEIINLLLLRGNIGRPGTGPLPVRGHSNIQGIRTAGIGEKMPDSFLDGLERTFHFKVPRQHGLGSVSAIKAMAEGRVRVLFSLGGNLAKALPDTLFTEKALAGCSLAVMIATKLNRTHLVAGRKALVLPCLGRTDEEVLAGIKQYHTTEDAMGTLSRSAGCLNPAGRDMRSEVQIISGMAVQMLGAHTGIDWLGLAADLDRLRSLIAQSVPDLKPIVKMKPGKPGVPLYNPLRERIFSTHDRKAKFVSHPLQWVGTEGHELLLMTIRSHDQFNTSVFGLNDRYRGIRNERRVLFMNPEDMEKRQLTRGQLVEIRAARNGPDRRLHGWHVVPYPVTKGCCAAYFPETNLLASIDDVAEKTGTPAYKSIVVKVLPLDGPGPG